MTRGRRRVLALVAAMWIGIALLGCGRYGGPKRPRPAPPPAPAEAPEEERERRPDPPP